jgi:hypothetical protein
MGVTNTLMVVGRARAFEVKGHNAGLVTIVEDEREWRAPPSGAALAPRVVVTRWRSLDPRTREVSAETRSDGQLISIVMRNANVRLSVSGRVVHDGAVMPGAVASYRACGFRAVRLSRAV